MVNVIILIYLVLVMTIGILAGRNIRSLSEYAVAGRSFGTIVIFFTLSASFIGGGFSMGNAEKVFTVGIVNIVALWGFSFKELLVARFIAPRVCKYDGAISVGDIMEVHYGKLAKVFTGVFGFILCAGILGAQIGAIGYVFNVFLGIDRFWGILLGCGIVITYATIGGMRAVVWTDVVQFVILAIGIPITLFFGIHEAGGVRAIMEAVPAEHFRLPTDPAALILLASLFLTFFLGETLVPPYLQRLLISRNPRSVTNGTLLSGLFSIPFFAITGLIGVVALALEPGLDPNLALPYVVQQSLPLALQGMVAAAVLAIIMSSADSFLNSAAISFMNDIVEPLRREPMLPENSVRMARVVTLAVGILALVFAVSIRSVLDILIYSYNFWAPIILVPLVSSIMGFRATRTRFMCGAGAGIAAVLIWTYVLAKPWGIDGLVIGVFANLILFFAVDRNPRAGDRQSARQAVMAGEEVCDRI